jgi:hypothetical protein
MFGVDSTTRRLFPLFYSAKNPAPDLGGRPNSGAGSLGGTTGSNRRDQRSRPLSKASRSPQPAALVVSIPVVSSSFSSLLFGFRSEAGSEPEERKQEESVKKRPAKTRTNWGLPENADKIAAALAMVEGNKSLKAAAKLSRIPFTVLQRRAKGTVERATELSSADEKVPLPQFMLTSLLPCHQCSLVVLCFAVMSTGSCPTRYRACLGQTEPGPSSSWTDMGRTRSLLVR